jgi:hypothetical protein
VITPRTTVPLLWGYDDGGRKAAGFTGSTGDCVTRAIAIATGRPYTEVYQYFMERYWEDKAVLASGRTLKGKHGRRRKPSKPRDGINPVHYEHYLTRILGWSWTPTMFVGQGCQVHLAAGEIPMEGRIITRLSKHLAAVIDGCVFDTSDPGRDGTRCVYGYWSPPCACRACDPGSRASRHTCGLAELQRMFPL